MNSHAQGRDIVEQALNRERENVFDLLLTFPPDDQCTAEQHKQKEELQERYNYLGRARQEYTQKQFG